MGLNSKSGIKNEELGINDNNKDNDRELRSRFCRQARRDDINDRGQWRHEKCNWTMREA